jgi:hypothetical protein
VEVTPPANPGPGVTVSGSRHALQHARARRWRRRAAADSLGLSQICRALLDPNDPDDSEHAAGGVSPVYPSARVVAGPGDPLPKLRVSNSVDSAVERANSGERANRSERANSGVQASSGERAAGFRDSVGGGREFAGKSSAGRFDYFARKVRLDLVEDVVLNVFLPHFGFPAWTSSLCFI